MAYALASDQLYLVSEHIEGCRLDNCLFCNDENAMTMSVTLTVSFKVPQAIVHSQDSIILHRDIKPENILVSQNSNVVQLRDMGLSKLSSMNTVMTTMAGRSSQPGTPAYQASEVMLKRSSSNFNYRCVSLACTLVEVMAKVPVWNPSEDQVQNILNRRKLKAKSGWFRFTCKRC
ncbi:probable serine/threonine-protein kinase DDB_G0286627 [Mercenaria mercenaria]|uniref:probable serine/threonine-protein kinase DDB_G0286627 n=1 Tax=Mercenaria mercenaria TaxID=6596 RepID=UPI00234F6A11|nr:probable serine/threonine-protein kinase DDB_G0286627 [Mercenaria mercenaria]